MASATKPFAGREDEFDERQPTLRDEDKEEKEKTTAGITKNYLTETQVCALLLCCRNWIYARIPSVCKPFALDQKLLTAVSKHCINFTDYDCRLFLSKYCIG